MGRIFLPPLLLCVSPLLLPFPLLIFLITVEAGLSGCLSYSQWASAPIIEAKEVIILLEAAAFLFLFVRIMMTGVLFVFPPSKVSFPSPGSRGVSHYNYD